MTEEEWLEHTHGHTYGCETWEGKGCTCPPEPELPSTYMSFNKQRGEWHPWPLAVWADNHTLFLVMDEERKKGVHSDPLNWAILGFNSQGWPCEMVWWIDMEASMKEPEDLEEPEPWEYLYGDAENQSEVLDEEEPIPGIHEIDGANHKKFNPPDDDIPF